MAHVFIQHRVADYDAWRPHYDADQPRRAAAGVSDVAVLRDADDPNSVWLVHEADASIVEPMLGDPELAEKMQAAGVVGPPQVWVS
jgi:hypothetical protein